MKKITITPLTLMEMIDLLEQGYHRAYEKDCEDYYIVLITNDNGEMEEKDIIDIYFDFEYIEVENSKDNFNAGNMMEMDKELVDKIASFFEEENNWSALKNCWFEDGRSDDLRRLLRKAIK